MQIMLIHLCSFIQIAHTHSRSCFMQIMLMDWISHFMWIMFMHVMNFAIRIMLKSTSINFFHAAVGKQYVHIHQWDVLLRILWQKSIIILALQLYSLFASSNRKNTVRNLSSLSSHYKFCKGMSHYKVHWSWLKDRDCIPGKLTLKRQARLSSWVALTEVLSGLWKTIHKSPPCLTYYCCGWDIALYVWFTTNRMCAKNNCLLAIIGWSLLLLAATVWLERKVGTPFYLHGLLPVSAQQQFDHAHRRFISLANSKLWLVLSNALDASKNAEKTRVSFFT